MGIDLRYYGRPTTHLEHDILLLADLPAVYQDLPVRLDQHQLDAGLDQLLAWGYITWRFDGRHVDVTLDGAAALRRVLRRGVRRGRFIDPGLLRPSRSAFTLTRRSTA